MATSVLSTRWLNLWTQLPVLNYTNFHLYRITDDNSTDLFVQFVDNVISRNILQIIEKFTLNYHYSCENNSLFRVNDWIQTVLLRDVVELNLKLHMGCRKPNCVCEEVGFRLGNCYKL